MRHPWSVVLALAVAGFVALTVEALDSGQVHDGRPPRGVNGGTSLWGTNGGVVNPNDDRGEGPRGIPYDGRSEVFLAAEVKAGKAGLDVGPSPNEPTANGPWTESLRAVGGGPASNGSNPASASAAAPAPPTPVGTAPPRRPRMDMGEKPWSEKGKVHGEGDTGQGHGPQW